MVAEHFGPCLVNNSKLNQTTVSHAADRQCQYFFCSAKGKGAVGMVKATRRVNFQAAVAILEPFISKERVQQKTLLGDN